MTQDIAAALLRDVPRFEPDNPLDSAPSMKDDPQGDWLSRDEVLAALSSALDPALTERAGEVLSRLRKVDEYEPLGHDGWEAADLITALLAQNAALRAERDALKRHNNALSQMLDGEETRAEAAEAKVEKLRGALEKAEQDFYEAANRFQDEDYEGPHEKFTVNVVCHIKPYFDMHMKHLRDSAAAARAALSATTEEGHE